MSGGSPQLRGEPVRLGCFRWRAQRLPGGRTGLGVNSAFTGPAPAQGADCPSGPAPPPSAASALSTELGSRPSAASPGPAFVETAGGRMWGPGSGEKHTVESGWLRQLICTPSLLGAWAELPPLPTCGSPPSLALRWALGSRRRDVDGSCHGNRSPPSSQLPGGQMARPRLRGP